MHLARAAGAGAHKLGLGTRNSQRQRTPSQETPDPSFLLLRLLLDQAIVVAVRKHVHAICLKLFTALLKGRGVENEPRIASKLVQIGTEMISKNSSKKRKKSISSPRIRFSLPNPDRALFPGCHSVPYELPPSPKPRMLKIDRD